MYRHLSLIVIVWAITFSNVIADWTPEVRISEPNNITFNPEMASVGDTIHVVYKNSSNGIGYVRSVDGGAIWSEPIQLSNSVQTSGVEFPEVLTSGQNVMALWRDRSHPPMRRNIGYAISTNGGGNWSEAQTILEYNWDHILYFSAACNDLTINLIFSGRIGQPLRFFNVTSTDFGVTWSDTTWLFDGNQSDLVNMAAYGNSFHFVWPGNFVDGDMWEMYYISSHDGGNTWSNNVPLADIDGYGSFWPVASTNGFGRVAVSWTDFKYSPNGWTADIFVKFSYNHGEHWTDEQQISFTHLDARSDIFWLGDSVHVVWERQIGGGKSVFYRFSSDNGSTWEDEVRLDSDPDNSKRPIVSISNNKRYAIWADDRNDPDHNIYRGVYFTYYDNSTFINNNYFPVEYEYLHAYPNPFNSSVTILMVNNDLEYINLGIYDVLGRLVYDFRKGGETHGLSKFVWDGRDDLGQEVRTGIYFAKMAGSQSAASLKIMYVK